MTSSYSVPLSLMIHIENMITSNKARPHMHATGYHRYKVSVCVYTVITENEGFEVTRCRACVSQSTVSITRLKKIDFVNMPVDSHGRVWGHKNSISRALFIYLSEDTHTRQICKRELMMPCTLFLNRTPNTQPGFRRWRMSTYSN